MQNTQGREGRNFSVRVSAGKQTNELQQMTLKLIFVVTVGGDIFRLRELSL